MKEQTDKFKHAGVFACPSAQQLALSACPLHPTISVARRSGEHVCFRNAASSFQCHPGIVQKRG